MPKPVHPGTLPPIQGKVDICLNNCRLNYCFFLNYCLFELLFLWTIVHLNYWYDVIHNICSFELFSLNISSFINLRLAFEHQRLVWMNKNRIQIYVLFRVHDHHHHHYYYYYHNIFTVKICNTKNARPELFPTHIPLGPPRTLESLLVQLQLQSEPWLDPRIHHHVDHPRQKTPSWSLGHARPLQGC